MKSGGQFSERMKSSIILPTAHPGKSIINTAAREELLRHFINYTTPGAKITAVTAGINPLEFAYPRKAGRDQIQKSKWIPGGGVEHQKIRGSRLGNT